jgi:hypothetical protein
MKPLELWRWRIHSPITGRLFTSRYAMTEADALVCDPLAARLPYSKEVRMVPENDEELDRRRTSAMVVPKSPTRRSPIPPQSDAAPARIDPSCGNLQTAPRLGDRVFATFAQ